MGASCPYPSSRPRAGATSRPYATHVSERSTLRRDTSAAKWGGGKTAPFFDELLDGKEPREVIDFMVRCRKWLESRGFEITMSCIYKEVKIRKIKLE